MVLSCGNSSVEQVVDVFGIKLNDASKVKQKQARKFVCKTLAAIKM